jgi:hypothetical protein
MVLNYGRRFTIVEDHWSHDIYICSASTTSWIFSKLNIQVTQSKIITGYPYFGSTHINWLFKKKKHWCEDYWSQCIAFFLKH